MLKPAFAGAVVALAPSFALAADAAVAPAIDLTAVVVAVVGGAFSIIGIVATAVVNKRLTDAKAAATLDNAINNSLGALQQAVQQGVVRLSPHVAMPGVTAGIAPAVQYVLDHAGDEAQRFGITPDKIAEKINAKLGLANIATNLAVTASPAPAIVPPTAPVPAPPKD